MRFSPMKMNSYRRNNRTTAGGTAFLAVLFCAAALFGIDTMTGGTLRSIAHSGGSVVWTAASSGARIINVRAFVTTKFALVEENALLQQQILERDEVTVRVAAIEAENELLRDMVRLAETDTGISARVISTFRSSPYGTFVIDAGQADGVKVESVVLTPSGYVLGKVTSVDAHSANVQSLFSPGMETDFIVNNVAFTAMGRGGGNTKADVPRDAPIATGDVVIAPTYGGRAAGVVGSIESASSSATKTLFIRIPTNLATLRFVYVISQ